MKPHSFHLLAAIAAMLVSASCFTSRENRLTELEERKKEWIAQMKEAFPEKTQDTLELRRRLDYYLETDNKIGQLSMYRVLGNEARNSSRFRAAIEYHTDGLAVAYEIFDTVSITVVMNDLATDFRRTGAFNEATPYHYEALRIAEEYRGSDTLSIERNMASAYNGIGSICRAMNEYDEAMRVYKKALELETKHSNYRGMAINLANIGAVYFERQEFDRAEEYYRASLENNEKAELPMGIALCRINIGEIYEVQGKFDDALREYEQAYDVMIDTSDKWHWLDACFAIANIHIRKGDYAQAAEYLDSGLATARVINSHKHLWKAHELLAVSYYNRGDYRLAVDNMRATHAYADTMRHNMERDRLLESTVQYETSQYARRIEDLDELNRQQAARQRTVMMLMVPLILGLVLLLVFYYYRRRLEQRGAAELKNIERMRSNFFTNITHELRTPITVINGLAGHLRRTMKDANDRETKDLEAICRQGENLMHLVNQLLEFSRSEAGVDRPKWRRGDMVEYLKILSEPYVRFAQSRGIRLVVYSETGSCEMNFTPSPLKKVMANLLSNAIRHCSDGDEIVVHFRYDATGRRCFIRVKDSGEGISPENLPRIFELYYTSASGNAGETGSGIGLALSKQLVEEMGGTIRVESTLGKGTEFTVSIPVSVAEIPADLREQFESADDLRAMDRPPEDEESQPEQAHSNGKKTVLVIEDSRDVAHYISTILEGRYSLLFAANGGEGLLMAERHIPDIIITDVMMPEKDGYAFTSELRASMPVSHIPVIMVTARGTTEDKLEGLKAGADAYLTKPFDERELLARIKQLLESRAMLMKTYSDALFHTDRSSQAASADQNMAFITKLSIAVNAHLADDGWFPNGLTAEMCLSESQLGRKLKAMTGHTISSFVMRARLNKAKQLLSKRDRSIKEVAFACGFSDLSYFSRSFRKVFGYTPSEFLKIPETNE